MLYSLLSGAAEIHSVLLPPPKSIVLIFIGNRAKGDTGTSNTNYNKVGKEHVLVTQATVMTLQMRAHHSSVRFAVVRLSCLLHTGELIQCSRKDMCVLARLLSLL